MSDLIDRNMAITHVNAVLFPKINTAKEVEKALRELPTIDAVQVVRCKYCKYNPKAGRRYDDDDPIFCFDWCWYMEGKDGYCCEGRKREEEKPD